MTCPPGAILRGDVFDVLPTLKEKTIQVVVTSPPYWGLRDYGAPGQLGLEDTPDLYVQNIVRVFRLVHRVLRDDGTLWLNLGDTYTTGGQGGHQVRRPGESLPTNFHGHRPHHGDRIRKTVAPPGLKPKDLVGVPWRVALALQADGWYLRSDIIWFKRNPMPESVNDRPTRAHEYLFLLTKSQRYYYDGDAISEPMVGYEVQRRLREMSQGLTTTYRTRYDQPHGQVQPGANSCRRQASKRQEVAAQGLRNRRSVWEIPTHAFPSAHFATFPEKLVEPCILAGSRPGDVVMDPFMGAGTTAVVAARLGRRYLGVEIQPDYVALANRRIAAAWKHRP